VYTAELGSHPQDLLNFLVCEAATRTSTGSGRALRLFP
jgi:hypothetical protein